MANKEAIENGDKYHIEKINGDVIYSNLYENCFNCYFDCKVQSETITCPVDSKKKKRGKIQSENGTVYLCSSSKDILNSQRIFNEKIKIYSEIITGFFALKELIAEDINKDTKRLIHNLTSINAHSIQEIYALVPQELLTKDITRQHSVIKQMILDDPDEAAKSFLRIAKNNASMKTEFSVFKKLNDSSALSFSFIRHPIRKVLMNVFHIFFQDFTDKGVIVVVENNFDYVMIDYESVYVALYHILENCTKYIAPNTRLKVSFLNGDIFFKICLDMISVQIKNSEVEAIFIEGIKGAMAVKAKQLGDGIGLSVVKKLLAFNSAELKIENNNYPYVRKVINQIEYENNIFNIIFTKKTVEDKELLL